VIGELAERISAIGKVDSWIVWVSQVRNGFGKLVDGRATSGSLDGE
jgi:hypothetical protein